MATSKRVSGKTVRSLDRQKRVQQQIDRDEKKKPSKSASKKAVQTGARQYPAPPMPKQHQNKPGLESEITPRPLFRNPDYLGSAKLDGMTALITGGDSGIGRAVAVLFAREGANVSILYLASDSDAEETRRVIVEEEGGRCILIRGDVTDPESCTDAVERTVGEFG